MPAQVKRGALFNNPRLPIKSPPEYPYAGDPFDRGDTPFPPVAGALGLTPVGKYQWLNLSTDGVSPSYAAGGAIVGGRMGITGQALPGTRRIATYFNAGISDFRLALRLVSGVKDTTVGIAFRLLDMNNYLFMTIVANKWALYKRVDGSGVQLYVPTNSFYASDGDVVDVLCAGASVTPRVNGISMPTQTINEFTTASRVGIVQTMPTGTTATPLTLFDDAAVSRLGTWAEV
ncbi:hypothetical protein [Microbacterium sp. IEGM 1404]|uniref:hypothetical protein n=1 Tax=Microbacterium sp. IEGM 1404 TaxID=3047084 RepID=UPI0024B84106|nr:hypothetical protein [Microbacterium sp. IEGM 1404]MDI9889990.1 hypothetical protein [Microbacterium sp. IEGM 1404]